MSTIGDKLFSGARPELGLGYQIAPDEIPNLLDAIYAAFGRGIDLSMSEENAPRDCAVYAIDMEVTRTGALRRSPGVVLVEDASPHNLRYTFEQSSLDYSTELVTIDPPYFGYKAGGNYNWINAGLLPTGSYGWCGVNVAGTLLVSNGIAGTYSRQPNAVVVVDESANVIARTLAVAFGRTFAGYYVDGGTPQSLGLKWNDASGLYNGWAGLGSGQELLLSDIGEADKIVGLLSIGLDALGIFNRKSLWVGYPTGDYLRPADPRIRVSGVGAVNRETIKLTPGGGTFLSDEGVALFDLTNIQIISEAINTELLPLDYTQLNKYTAAYIPTLQRYVLCTPTCMWIYEYPHPNGRPGRWFKRSLVADNVLSWTVQVGGSTWDSMVGTWDASIDTWDELALIQSDAQSILHMIVGTKLVKELQSSFTNLTSSLTPLWRTPQNEKVKVTDQYTTVGFEVTYRSDASSSIKLSSTNDVGDIVPGFIKALPNSAGKWRSFILWNESTGMGAKAQIEVVSGDPEIRRVRQLLLPSGPTLVSL